MTFRLGILKRRGGTSDLTLDGLFFAMQFGEALPCCRRRTVAIEFASSRSLSDNLGSPPTYSVRLT